MHIVHNNIGMNTAYVSGRVPARYERLVTKQARAARTSKSDLVARYVIEKSVETDNPGISFRDSLSGREAYLTGHRVAVWEVVSVHDEVRARRADNPPFRMAARAGAAGLEVREAFPEEIRAAHVTVKLTPARLCWLTRTRHTGWWQPAGGWRQRSRLFTSPYWQDGSVAGPG